MRQLENEAINQFENETIGQFENDFGVFGVSGLKFRVLNFENALVI